MKILLVTIDFPLPVNSGGVVRLLGISEALGRRGHELTMLARLREPGIERAQIDELAERLSGASVEVFAPPVRPAPGGPVRALGRWVYGAATGTPPWVWSDYSRAMAVRLRELAPEHDVCLILDDNAHQYALDASGIIPAVLDKQNVRSASWNATNQWGGMNPTLAQRVKQGIGHRLIVNWERTVANAADAVVVTSADERVRFRKHIGLDCDWVGSAIATPRLIADPVQASPSVVWLGDHRYRANVDGLIRFLKDGWAPLGQRGFRLKVAGREPGAEILRLAEELPGVDVLGFVDDLDQLLGSAAAAVVPVWHGAGIKMKTLVLMGSGLPVAATSVGMEGISFEDGVDARVGDDPIQLAAAVSELLDDRQRATSIGQAGHARIVEDHTWDGVISQIEDVLERVQRLSSHRPE